MTLDELSEHIAALLTYNWSDEYHDAKENGLDDRHIFNHMLALAEFIGDDVTEERAALDPRSDTED